MSYISNTGNAQSLFDLFFGGAKSTPSQPLPSNNRPSHFVPSDPLLKKLIENDHFLIPESHNIIAGFLNLGAKDGWNEGGNPDRANKFICEVLRQYTQKDVPNKALVQRIEKIFLNQVEYLPKNGRLCYDQTILGWKRHSISRLVGNLASSYQESKPFFEILINSQTENPFTVSIYVNKDELIARRNLLINVKDEKQDLAKLLFYHGQLVKPGKFLENNKNKMGANATRILKGLDYLEKKKINAQIVGNCWMKQPMRALLSAIFIDLLDSEPKMRPEELWKKAVTVYKAIQKEAAIPYVESLLLHQTGGLSKQMITSAQNEINRRKKAFD